MTIRVSPKCFGPRDDDPDFNYETVVVKEADNPRRAKRALDKAGEKLMSVTEIGTILEQRGLDHFYSWDEHGNATEVAEDEYYTPNYVSSAHMTPDGPEIYLDCKGQIEPEMTRKLVEVLVEELRAGGVKDCFVDVVEVE